MALTNAEKQAAYRKRLRAEGKTQKLVTVETESWARGMPPAWPGIQTTHPRVRETACPGFQAILRGRLIGRDSCQF